MKDSIHPNYYQAKVVCNCGNEFVTGSTKEDIHVEICSKCHPFYTGQSKAASARGAIEKFNKKYGLQKDTCSEANMGGLQACPDPLFEWGIRTY